MNAPDEQFGRGKWEQGETIVVTDRNIGLTEEQSELKQNQNSHFRLHLFDPKDEHLIMTYSEQWWDDMPEVAHKFAAKLGYNKEKWDADSTIPYDTKTFFQCTDEEKQAAMFLGLSPIDKKLNVWWADLDKATKEHAIALGWLEEKWDDDWEIYHLDIDKKYWDELDKAQQKAANHFGYTKATWDETYAEEDTKTVRAQPLEFCTAQ